MEAQATYLDEPDKRKLLNRLSRVEGQVRALKKLVEEAKCADEVLVQAAAARGALGQFMARLIELHLADCVNSCMEGDRVQVSERLSKALSMALRLST
jgi:DNA-binding FrmR family transcriptional regulator